MKPLCSRRLLGLLSVVFVVCFMVACSDDDGDDSPVSSFSFKLHVGPTADGLALTLLDRDFELIFLDEDPNPAELRPLVVGPGELDNTRYIVLLQEAYAAGHTVGITNAFPEEAQRLHQALGFASGCAQGDDSEAPLVAIQQGGDRHQTQRSTYVMMPRQVSDKTFSGNISQADHHASLWLRERFAQSPPSPATDPDSCSDPQSCLITLASSTACNWLQQDSKGDSIEIVNNIWTTRSFEQSLDYYYVEQETQYFIHNGAHAMIWANGVTNALTDPMVVPVTTQPSPGSTTCSTSITTGVGFSFGGNAGYSEYRGFNVTPANVGMDISNSTTTTCPSTLITYSGDPSEGTTIWNYELDENNANYNNQTFVITNHWVWEIGFGQYGPTQTDIQFTSVGTFLAYGLGPAGSDCYDWCTVNLNATNTVPLPFDTFTLADPVVRGVDPTSVERGQQFKIEGSGFYPSLVSAVQLGGNSLPAGNYTPTSDTSITVVVPNTTNTGNQSVGVQTSQGQSNTNVQIDVEK